MTSFKASKKDSEKSQFKSCFRLAHGCLIAGSTDTLNWNDFFPQKTSVICLRNTFQILVGV